MYAFAIDGTPITGTLETIPGTALVSDGSFKANAEGVIEYENDGGTKVDWDGQETVVRDGKKMFVDEDGDAWPENEIVLHEASDIYPEELAFLIKREGPLVVLGDDIDRVLYEVFDIDWDTSDDNFDASEGQPDLPTELVVSINPDEDDFDFADALSDRYGFCINGLGVGRRQPETA